MSVTSPHPGRSSMIPQDAGSAALFESPKKHSRLSLQDAFRSPPPISNTIKRREISVLQSPSTRSVSTVSSVYHEAAVNDLVEVPGNHHGTVMFVGPVDGRQGIFLGIDLDHPDLDKGRNNGTHNGIRYFQAKGPRSGIFVPQGRCRILESRSRPDSSAQGHRPVSRQIQGRSISRNRSFSNRSFSSLLGTDSMRPPISESSIPSDTAKLDAAGLQRLMNDNARLKKELEQTQVEMQELRTKNAIQAQEMEELITTLSELESLQSDVPMQKSTLQEVSALRTFLEDRERKIDDLRHEAEVRRHEFREVTEHQQATIDELKVLHEAQLATLQAKYDEIEERFLNSAGDADLKPTQAQPEGMETLQTQLLELGYELDALVEQQERARQDIDIANARIEELERENDQLLGSLASAQTQLESAGSSQSRSVASIEKLPESHPQKRQTIKFLENEVQHLREEKAAAWGNSEVMQSGLPSAIVEEMAQLKSTISDLQGTNPLKLETNLVVQDLRLALEEEKTLRRALEERNRDLKITLEQTILHTGAHVSPSSSVHRSIESPTRPRPQPNAPGTVSPEIVLRSRGTERDSTDLSSDGVLFCEFCEQEGHDIVSCNQVFGSSVDTPLKPDTSTKHIDQLADDDDDNETY